MVAIEIRHMTAFKIFNYLSKNDLLFKPPLSTRTDVEKYAAKLNEYAVHFCAIKGENLIGFLGCYFNDPQKEFGFISSFSVTSEFQGKGLAKKLLRLTIEYGIRHGFRQIRLQVHISNLSAIELYSKSGFKELTRNTNLSEMVLDLPDLKR